MGVQNLEKIVRFLARNQKRQNEEDNYVMNISRELDMHRATVMNHIETLESIGAASKSSNGRKNIILLKNPVLEDLDFSDENFELDWKKQVEI